jgi:hypothetical protein
LRFSVQKLRADFLLLQETYASGKINQFSCFHFFSHIPLSFLRQNIDLEQRNALVRKKSLRPLTEHTGIKEATRTIWRFQLQAPCNYQQPLTGCMMRLYENRKIIHKPEIALSSLHSEVFVVTMEHELNSGN